MLEYRLILSFARSPGSCRCSPTHVRRFLGLERESWEGGRCRDVLGRGKTFWVVGGSDGGSQAGKCCPQVGEDCQAHKEANAFLEALIFCQLAIDVPRCHRERK